MRDLKRPLFVGMGIGFLAALLFLVGVLDTWSARATDRLFLSHPVDPSITVVAIDDNSISQIGRWPWPRSVHAELIQKIYAAGARVIGYDVNFPESSSADDDQVLASALKRAGNVVLPLELQFQETSGNAGIAYNPDPKTIVMPITSLSTVAASTGHSNTLPDRDGVVRSLIVNASTFEEPRSIPSFVAEVVRLAGRGQDLAAAPLGRADRMLINFPNVPHKAFRTFSAVDVLRDRADLSLIKGGIVFVGSTAADLHDALLVPTSNGVPMPGVEIHAAAYDTIVGHRWLQPVPVLLVAFLLIVLGFLVSLLVALLRARWGVLAVLILWILWFVAAFILFDRGWIMDLVWPTLVLIFAYAAVTLERRVTADRQRRQLKTVISQYLSPSVVESILKHPEKMKLGGERRRMSVLFSDIRGFTTISEGLTPEKLVEILNQYLDRMTKIVFEHEGVLDKYIGDAVMAFWNAPFDQPDHALRGVTTALHMRDALAEMDTAHAFGNLELKIGIGVNTGDMVVGNVGGEARFDYTVIGDNVNLGSRLEGLTKEYGVMILMTEATRMDLKEAILVRRLDKVAVKGKKEPVVIYEAMEFASRVSPEQQKLAVDFEAALEKYFSRDFAGTIEACDEIFMAHPTDGPTRTLKTRAEHFTQEPPPADWVGTWVYTKK